MVIMAINGCACVRTRKAAYGRTYLFRAQVSEAHSHAVRDDEDVAGHLCVG